MLQEITFYNPEFPKYSVLEQMPLANSKVKENRIIYLTTFYH